MKGHYILGLVKFGQIEGIIENKIICFWLNTSTSKEH